MKDIREGSRRLESLLQDRMIGKMLWMSSIPRIVTKTSLGKSRRLCCDIFGKALRIDVNGRLLL
jgi:hypothetical protein